MCLTLFLISSYVRFDFIQKLHSYLSKLFLFNFDSIPFLNNMIKHKNVKAYKGAFEYAKL